MTKTKKASVREMSEGESIQVKASVKSLIQKQSEPHPFYDQTADKSVVVVSREIEFVDSHSRIYTIPCGVTITVFRGEGGEWNIVRHID